MLLLDEAGHVFLEPAQGTKTGEGVAVGGVKELFLGFTPDPHDVHEDTDGEQGKDHHDSDGPQGVFDEVGAPAPLGVDFRGVFSNDGLDLRRVQVFDFLAQDGEKPGVGFLGDGEGQLLGGDGLPGGDEVRVLAGLQHLLGGQGLDE